MASSTCEFGVPVALSRTLRVLQITPRYFPEMGGIETHVHEVSQRLAAAGVKVGILTSDRAGSLPGEEVIGEVRVRRVPAWPKKRDYYFAPGIFREVASGEWDVIHIQGCHTFVAPFGMLAAIKAGVPFVVTFHSGGHSSFLRNAMRSIQWALLGPLVRRASNCIGVSKFEAELFSSKMKVARNKFTVIPNGAQMPQRRQHSYVESNGIRIVSIGRLEQYKGHHRVIEAMPEILKRFPDAELRILGEGPYKKKLQDLAERKGVAGHVVIGGIPPAERGALADTLSAASLVVLLSEYEAHPVAVMEALSLRRPVLVTNCTGFMEMVEEGLVQSVSPKASPSDVARAIIEEIESDRPQRHIDLPTWDQCTNLVLRAYEKAINGKMSMGASSQVARMAGR